MEGIKTDQDYAPWNPYLKFERAPLMEGIKTFLSASILPSISFECAPLMEGIKTLFQIHWLIAYKFERAPLMEGIKVITNYGGWECIAA